MSGIITTLPDLGKSMKILQITMELENISDETVFGAAIRKALRENKRKEVIEMIQSQALDNRSLVADIVGEDILKQIETI